MYAHQDWEPVVFRKKQSEQKRPVVVNPSKKFDEAPEVFHHKKISKELADTVRNKRLELGLTQQALATRICEKPNVIQEIESMKGVYNHVTINKTLRALGLSLKDIPKKHS